MFIIYYCNGALNDMSYDIKINKEEKETLIHRYSLDRKGDYKELWENNVCITLSKDKRIFQYIEDIRLFFITSAKDIAPEWIRRHSLNSR